MKSECSEFTRNTKGSIPAICGSKSLLKFRGSSPRPPPFLRGARVQRSRCRRQHSKDRTQSNRTGGIPFTTSGPRAGNSENCCPQCNKKPIPAFAAHHIVETRSADLKSTSGATQATAQSWSLRPLRTYPGPYEAAEYESASFAPILISRAGVEMLDICLSHPKPRRPRQRSQFFAPLFGMIRNRSTTIPSRRAERNSENLYLRAAENALTANDRETPAGRLNVQRTCSVPPPVSGTISLGIPRTPSSPAQPGRLRKTLSLGEFG